MLNNLHALWQTFDIQAAQTYKTLKEGEMLMHVFEFQAKPKNGCIEIPAEYQDKIAGTVRVIILSQEQSLSAANIIDQLLENPLEIKGFAPFTREKVYERR